MFEFKFRLDMTCVADRDLEDMWFDEAEAKGDNAFLDGHQQRPATGYIVWNKPEDLSAALDYIFSFMPVFVPWLCSTVGENIHSWLRYDDLTHHRMQEVTTIWYDYDYHADEENVILDVPNDDVHVERDQLWILCFDRDGELPDDFMEVESEVPRVLNGDPRPVRMANMFWGNEDACIMFTDIVAAVKRKRADQVHAMLLATKRPHDGNGKQATALGRATRNWLYDPNVFHCVTDFL
jgi:hypothetical protein